MTTAWPQTRGMRPHTKGFWQPPKLGMRSVVLLAPRLPLNDTDSGLLASRIILGENNCLSF